MVITKSDNPVSDGNELLATGCGEKTLTNELSRDTRNSELLQHHQGVIYLPWLRQNRSFIRAVKTLTRPLDVGSAGLPDGLAYPGPRNRR